MAKEYIFRVKPKGYRNNYRVIRIGCKRTLDDLHMAILDAYDFTAEHLYMFSPNRKPYDRNGYYSPYDEEHKSADQAVLEALGLKLGDCWLYLYDFGDDWMFDVTLESIEDGRGNKKAEVMDGKGELEQYPDWEEDEDDGEEWLTDEDMELPYDLEGLLDEDLDSDELSFDLDDEIVVDVLDEDENMEVLLSDDDEGQLDMIRERLGIKEDKPAGKKKKTASVRQSAAAIVKTLKKDPELLERLLGANGLCLLIKMAQEKKLRLRECVIGRNDLGMMDALGIILLEERDGGILYLTKDAVTFASYFMEKERKAGLEKRAEKERLFLAILLFYQVMEADRLYEMFCGLFSEECTRQEFDGMLQVLEFSGRLATVTSGKDDTKYLTSLTEYEDDAPRILAMREIYQVPDYCPKTRQELETCYREGIMPPAMPGLLEYLIAEKQMKAADCYSLEKLMKTGADLGLEFSDIEDEVREVLNENGLRLTKRVREMMTRVMEGFPSAALKGYTMEEFRKLYPGKNPKDPTK